MEEDLSCSHEIDSPASLHFNALFFLNLNCLIEVASLIANAIFLVTLVNTRSLHIPSNMLLGALCIMDLSICTLLQPVLIYEVVLFLTDSSESEATSWLWLAWDVIFGFSFTLITLVSFDRYVAICHPFWYQRKATCKTHISAALVGCSIFSVIFSLDFIIPENASTPLVAIGTAIAARIVHYFLPAVAFIFCYSKIYIVIRQQRRTQVSIGEITSSERTQETRKKTERGRTCTISLIVSCFFITYAPSLIWMVIKSVSNFCEDSLLVQVVSIWTTFSLLLSSLINPFVYYLRSKDVRVAAKRIIRCKSTV